MAHALEAAAADQGEAMLHGEAVAIGLRFALFEAKEARSQRSLGEDKLKDAAWIERWLQTHLPMPELTWPTAESFGIG